MSLANKYLGFVEAVADKAETLSSLQQTFAFAAAGALGFVGLSAGPALPIVLGVGLLFNAGLVAGVMSGRNDVVAPILSILVGSLGAAILTVALGVGGEDKAALTKDFGAVEVQQENETANALETYEFPKLVA